MSMISAQIDELRKWADQLSERENEFGVVVRALVAALRDAADTILQLRDDLQQANAENAKLRNGYGSMSREHSQTIVELSDAYYSIDQLKAENAKLRDLCYELLDNLMPEICARANWCRDKDWHKCEDYECGNFTFVILARELGVEVDE